MSTRAVLALAVPAVAAGGAIGACLRWQLSSWFPADASSFPWTTFAINVAGSFLIALLPSAAWVRRHPVLPPMLGAGLLGGFTTLSTYSEETRSLMASGHMGLAGTYLLGTLAACLLAVAAADRFIGAAARTQFRDEEGDR
jgi:fluoride exporter